MAVQQGSAHHHPGHIIVRDWREETDLAPLLPALLSLIRPRPGGMTFTPSLDSTVDVNQTEDHDS